MFTDQEVYIMSRNHPEAIVQLRLRIIQDPGSGKSIRQIAKESRASRNTIRRIWRDSTIARDAPNICPGKAPEEVGGVRNIALKEPTCGRIRIAGGMKRPVSTWTVRHILRRLREQGWLPPYRKKTSRKGYREERSVQEWRKKVGLEDAVWVQVDRKTIAEWKHDGVGMRGKTPLLRFCEIHGCLEWWNLRDPPECFDFRGPHGPAMGGPHGLVQPNRRAITPFGVTARVNPDGARFKMHSENPGWFFDAFRNI